MPAAYKGVRVPQTLRLPADLHRALVAAAHTRRRSMNEYITELLAEACPVPVPPPVGVRLNQNVYDDNGNRILS